MSPNDFISSFLGGGVIHKNLPPKNQSWYFIHFVPQNVKGCKDVK